MTGTIIMRVLTTDIQGAANKVSPKVVCHFLSLEL